ncbi:response regulator [Candidatus Woesearchaeota archaeon]|nr:response regulator [Candidatus Woesearchaeota archaeon]
MSDGRIDTEGKKHSVLFVDDEKNMLNIYSKMFGDNYDICIAESAEQGLELLAENECAVVVTDRDMSGMRGPEMLKIVERDYPDITRILVSGRGGNNGVAQVYLPKPFNHDMIKTAVAEGIESYIQRCEGN